MKYIKFTAWMVVLLVIISLGFKAKKQRDNQNALVAAEELATYGLGGRKAKASMPEDWNIKITGEIERGVSYVIRVSYYSQSDSKLCQSKQLMPFSPDRTATKLYAYYPEISDGKHSITIPLTEHDPKEGCKYRVHNVRMNLDLDKGKYLLPSGAFMLFYADWAVNKLNPPGYGFRRRQVNNRLINIECVLPDPNNLHFSSSPCGLAPVEKRFAVSQRLPIDNSTYEINISFLSQGEYIEKRSTP